MDTLVLIERVPYIARLAIVDVAFLSEQHRQHLELLPTGRGHHYRLTARGCVGTIVAPGCRLVIRPKIPLANVFAMLDPLTLVSATHDDVTPTAGDAVLNFLAGQFACRVRELLAAGLHRKYRERTEHGSVLQGQLDLSAQLRVAPGRKDQLHGRFDELSVDVTCNRIVKATMESLLASPLVGVEVQALLRSEHRGFDGVSALPSTSITWERIEDERVPEEYRSLLQWCRLLADGLRPSEASGKISAPAFLLDMERAFEGHVTRAVREAFTGNGHYRVAVQKSYTVTESADLVVRPDVAIECEGRAVLIVDAKWKRRRGSAATEDTYQVLAYGATLGAESVVLVYPGKRWSTSEYRFRHTPLRLMVCTLGVHGSREKCGRSLTRLGRMLKKML